MDVSVIAFSYGFRERNATGISFQPDLHWMVFRGEMFITSALNGFTPNPVYGINMFNTISDARTYIVPKNKL